MDFSFSLQLTDEVHRRRRCPVFIDLPYRPSFLKGCPHHRNDDF